MSQGYCRNYNPVWFSPQNVSAELQEALEERDLLKEQIQDYMVEVKRIEELLTAKVRTYTVL